MLRSVFVRAISLPRSLNPSDDDADYASLIHILILRVVGFRRKHPLRPVAQILMNSGPECLIPKPLNGPEDTMILLVSFKTDSEHGWVLLSAEA